MRYTGTKVLRSEGAATRRRIRDACRADRQRLTEDARKRREALSAAIKNERAALRGSCATKLEEARARTNAAIAEAQHTAMHLDRLRKVSRSPAQTAAAERARARRAENIRESDDEVRRNLSPELAIIWEKVKSRIRPSSRRTRTEAFIEWVEEHGSEAARILDEHAEMRFAREETEAEYLERTRPRPTRQRRIANLDRQQELAPDEIPF